MLNSKWQNLIGRSYWCSSLVASDCWNLKAVTLFQLWSTLVKWLAFTCLILCSHTVLNVGIKSREENVKSSRTGEAVIWKSNKHVAPEWAEALPKHSCLSQKLFKRRYGVSHWMLWWFPELVFLLWTQTGERNYIAKSENTIWSLNEYRVGIFFSFCLVDGQN